LSAAQIIQEQLAAPNVQILPRFTAENYWIDPGELWSLIPPQVRVALADAQAQLRIALDAQRAAWTAHGAMWCVMLGRQAALNLGFPAELIDSPVTDEEKIRAILNGWHDHLKPEDILAEYRAERDKALARPEHEQYAQVIHGKRFFRKVVVRELSKAFHLPNKPHGEWAADLLASTTGVPTDLRPVLEKLLA